MKEIPPETPNTAELLRRKRFFQQMLELREIQSPNAESSPSTEEMVREGRNR